MDVSFLSDEQELEQMVRDAQLEMEQLQLSTARYCLPCPAAPAPAEESSSSSSYMDNNEEDAPIMSSPLFPPAATPAPMEKALLNGSLGSFEAFDDDDKVVLVDFIGEAMEDMDNDGNYNNNTLNTSSIEEEHLLTARRVVEKFDAGDSSVSQRGRNGGHQIFLYSSVRIVEYNRTEVLAVGMNYNILTGISTIALFTYWIIALSV